MVRQHRPDTDGDTCSGGRAGEDVDTCSGGQKKPNILFIMGDDIGWMQPSIYHEGLAVGKRPTSTASGMKAQSS